MCMMIHFTEDGGKNDESKLQKHFFQNFVKSGHIFSATYFHLFCSVDESILTSGGFFTKFLDWLATVYNLLPLYLQGIQYLLGHNS